MKGFFVTVLASAAVVLAAPSPVEQGPITARAAAPAAACATAVTLSGNPFASRKVYANAFYSSEVMAASAVIAETDAALATAAAKVAQVGTFMWM
jgi:cellulose 1,4-beta-cellobiosidase